MEMIADISPRKILKLFSDLPVHGVDISSSLSTLLILWNYHKPDERQSLAFNWRGLADRCFPLYHWNLRRQSGDQKIADLPRADVLCLVNGVARVAQISKPIIQSLAPASRLVIFTDHNLELDIEAVTSASFSSFSLPPTYYDELKRMWPILCQRVMEATRCFGLSGETSHQLLAVLGSAILNW